jgi:hypothetical protein
MHATRGRKTSLLLDSAHHHAQMPGFNNDANPLRLERFVYGIRNLYRQSFLNLKPAGENVHNAGQFAETDDLPGRHIGHVALAIKRQHVVLA